MGLFIKQLWRKKKILGTSSASVVGCISRTRNPVSHAGRLVCSSRCSMFGWRESGYTENQWVR